MNRLPQAAIAAILLLGDLGAKPVRGESDKFQSAIEPLSAGVPEVAAARLESFLKSNPPTEVKRAARRKLGESLIASRRFEEALEIVDDSDLRGTSAAKFLRAQALAGLERWAEALPLYQEIAAQADAESRSEARFGAAEALRALDRPDEALQLFATLFSDPKSRMRARLLSIELLLDKGDLAAASHLLDQTGGRSAVERKQRRFLRGRLEAQSNHRDKAMEIFESIVRKPEGASHAVMIAALFAIADTAQAQKTPEMGDDFLEDFIEHHPEDPALPAVLAKLDQLYSAERKPSRRELGHWANDSVQPRRNFARWYLARMDLRAGRRDNALQILGQLAADPGSDPRLAGALLELAQLQMQDHRIDEAVATLEAARGMHPPPVVLGRIDFQIGKARYQAGRFDAAADSFEKVARAVPEENGAALFNAALTSLRLGNKARFLTNANEFAERSMDKENRAELALQKGLVEAAQGDKQAADSLRAFVRDFPRSKKISEAFVALAELAFHASPPRLDEARANLNRVADAAPTESATERADYLEIWLADEANGGADGKVIELASAFLTKHSTSALVPEVRMKLGEAAYRRQDFANAQTQFEILARENADSTVTEKALFFAAESAMRSMGAHSLDRALMLFDEVVKWGGELRWPARNEQAIIERKLGKPEQAITLYDEVLKGEAKAAEKREALCGQGDIFLETAAANPEDYARAAELFDQLAAPADAPPHWRNQALFKKGMCQEKLGDRTAALQTFYSVVESALAPGGMREFFWFYKAGFNGARLLEDDAKWESAAAIYQKLASAGGARSEEAAARLSRLRLEHFLWEQ